MRAIHFVQINSRIKCRVMKFFFAHHELCELQAMAVVTRGQRVMCVTLVMEES
jgi:hypothetical protein